MDHGSNFDNDQRIAELEAAIPVLERKADFAARFKDLYEYENFQIVIMDTLLGSEMTLKAESLVDPRMDEELEQETLVVLRSLRYLNKFIMDKLYDAEHATDTLKANKDLLLQLQMNSKDI